MRKISGILALVLAFTLFVFCGTAETAETEAPVVVLRIADYGDVYLEVYPDIAPATAENFLKLVDSGFYNGLTFHRIISGFMVQGGDPNGNGTGGSSETVKGEFSSNGFENPLLHERGVVSMARSGDPDSASSQFFIMHAAASHLDGSYAAFGRVIAGMGTVDSMCRNAHVTDSNGTVPAEDQPVITEAVRADRAEAEAAAEREAQNGRAGGAFDDPTSGLSFPLPEGWYLQNGENGVWNFTDGTSVFTVSTTDYWRIQGKSGQAQVVEAGFDRAAMTTAIFSRTGFADSVGVAEDQMIEETVNGVLWVKAEAEENGEQMVYRFAAVNGTVILIMSEKNAEPAVVSVMETLTVE